VASHPWLLDHKEKNRATHMEVGLGQIGQNKNRSKKTKVTPKKPKLRQKNRTCTKKPNIAKKPSLSGVVITPNFSQKIKSDTNKY